MDYGLPPDSALDRITDYSRTRAELYQTRLNQAATDRESQASGHRFEAQAVESQTWSRSARGLEQQWCASSQ
eukprot:7909954-Alexandrium_andersonii.AAC.1